MTSIERLTELFKDFPGIGPRQAKRFVYFLLTRPESYRRELISHIENIKNNIQACASCFRFFEATSVSQKVCSVCSNPNRDNSSLLIVSRDIDFENIERSRSFNGTYFILGGSIPILEKNPELKIRAKELASVVKKKASESGLKEIIIALNANPEGENTAQFVTKFLEPLTNEFGLKVSTLGRGLSTGTEIEYSDSETIKNAIKNRF
ncbi:MAG: toprim domain-containing protein [Candidatus Paceibacterota bacterium]